MTDTFVKEGETEQTTNTDAGFQSADQGTGGEGNGVDTQSPEYQIQVMQKRLSDKDEHIKTLESENQQTREMYATLEERMQNLSKIEEVLKKQGQETQDVSNQDTGLDEDALVGKVIENLNQKQTEQKMEQNYQTVLNRLKQEYGEQYVEEKVAEVANANGLSIDDMVTTARKSPQAFYRIAGLATDNTQQRAGSPAPTRGSQTPPPNNNERDFAFYARLMRENPREYWKPETQREFRKLFADKK